MFGDRRLTLFWLRVSLTWALTLVETGLWVLVPLLLGFAIDGLPASDLAPSGSCARCWSRWPRRGS